MNTTGKVLFDIQAMGYDQKQVDIYIQKLMSDYKALEQKYYAKARAVQIIEEAKKEAAEVISDATKECERIQREEGRMIAEINDLLKELKMISSACIV